MVHWVGCVMPADLGDWIGRNTHAKMFFCNRDTVFLVLHVRKASAKRVPCPRSDFRMSVKFDFLALILEFSLILGFDCIPLVHLVGCVRSAVFGVCICKNTH